MNTQFTHVYFVGIGGIGMSAIARYFHAAHKVVSGYDKTETILTKELVDSGIDVHYDEDVSKIPDVDKQNIVVIYTPAIPVDHKELVYFKEHNYTILKRSEALGIITKNSVSMAVAGTHGKTTTSTILGHIMYTSDKNATAFLGGISTNYNTNLLLGDLEYTVLEADEYDRSFLKLYPDMGVITNMDADHLDIYGTDEGIKEGFKLFSERFEDTTKLLTRKGLPIQYRTYSATEEAEFCVKEYRIENGVYKFTLTTPDKEIENLVCNLPGHHNLENTVAAASLALLAGVTEDHIRTSLQSFKGIQRRFTVGYQSNDKVYIDDYAHHPSEIAALHQAVREFYPEKKILAIFQPHLFSRTKDFVDGFAEELSNFDEVVLLPIYPARELPMQGVTSDWLKGKMKNSHVEVISKENVLRQIKEKEFDILLTIGAGDINTIYSPIKNWLES